MSGADPFAATDARRTLARRSLAEAEGEERRARMALGLAAADGADLERIERAEAALDAAERTLRRARLAAEFA